MSIIGLYKPLGPLTITYTALHFFCDLFGKCCSSMQLSAEQHGDVGFGEERKDGILSIQSPQLTVALLLFLLCSSQSTYFWHCYE